MKLFDNSLPTHHRLANIRDNHSLDLAEHYFRRGIEVFKQAGNEGSLIPEPFPFGAIMQRKENAIRR